MIALERYYWSKWRPKNIYLKIYKKVVIYEQLFFLPEKSCAPLFLSPLADIHT